MELAKTCAMVLTKPEVVKQANCFKKTSFLQQAAEMRAIDRKPTIHEIGRKKNTNEH